ncbi:MAG: cobyrinate a,c-diamide synthase [Coprococcus sp.]|nr:cobyrinate a,c-diamide synthase [Coprococcus sp.]
MEERQGSRKGGGFMVAAPASGSGKTALVCGLIEAYRQKGQRAAACKCGPDYIDGLFHQEILGVDSENLDLFFSGKEGLKERFFTHAEENDITVVEGVMGYYDGLELGKDQASSYEIASVLHLPVLLVLPCRGMALTTAALLKGLLEFRKDSQIKGVILNRITPMLYPRMKEMLEKTAREMGHEIKVFGYMPEDAAFQFESRHLGLKLPGEIRNLKDQVRRAARILTETVDLSGIMELAKENVQEGFKWPEHAEEYNEKPGRGVRVGVARDPAFCFYYKANLELLASLGCELVFFSPLKDEHLPEDLDGLLLGGGYPELYAAELSANTAMRREIKDLLAEGNPCVAECGGFLYLQEELEGADGVFYPMAGALAGKASGQGRLVRFGYIEVIGEKDGNFLKKGEKIRGHEHHYWDSTENGENCLAVKPDGKRSWEAVHMEGNLFAGFPHLYWPSHPEFARRFVRACSRRRV